MYKELRPLRFLVVDDLGQMRTTLRRMLSELGAEHIDLAANGEVALTQMTHHRYQVVLCDYNLGDGKDGQQILEEARHRRLLAVSTAYLMITAESALPMVLGALEQQPDDYLVKPFVREVLLQRLLRCIGRKRALAPLETAMAEGDHATAVALCEQMASDEPRRAIELSRLKGELLIKLGRGDEAAELYGQLLSQRDFPWARFGAARACMVQGRHDDARSALEQLVRDHPKLTEAYDCLADIHEAAQRPADAQAVLEQAVSLSPKSVRRQQRLGRIAVDNDDLDVAARAYRSAINHGRDSCFGSAQEYSGLSLVLQRKGDGARASSILRDGRKHFADRPAEQLGLICAQASFYRDSGQAAEADRLVGEALALAERVGEIGDDARSLQLAEACLASGAHRDAGVNLLTALTRSHHDDAPALAAVQQVCDRAGLDADARARIDQGRQETVRLNNEGVTLFKQGQLDAAARLFEGAAERMPHNRTLNLNAAKVLLQRLRGGGPDDDLERVRHYLERLQGQPDPTGSTAQSWRVFRSLAAQRGIA